MVSTLEAITDYERALVIGIGGGGDIVGTIPTGRLLQTLGVEVYLGGIAWQPVPRDVKPGPTPLAELLDVTPLAAHVARVHPHARTIDGTQLPEGIVAEAVDEPVFILDVVDGPFALADSLAGVLDEHHIDLVVGIDAGGDVLAIGTESGIRSPISDAFGLLLLRELDVTTLVGVIGYGSDGELTLDELNEAVSELARRDGLLGAWGITPRVRDELEGLLESVETEASRLPVEAAGGSFGRFNIRDGRRIATITPSSMITYYFDTQRVIDRSMTVRLIESATGVGEAAERLKEAGIHTELDTERSLLRDDTTS